jgi:hypothetical protein
MHAAWIKHAIIVDDHISRQENAAAIRAELLRDAAYERYRIAQRRYSQLVRLYGEDSLTARFYYGRYYAPAFDAIEDIIN